MSTTSNTTHLNEGRDQTKQRKDNNQKVILFWTEFYGMIPTALSQTFFDRCPESKCVATMDRRRLQEADVVVFFLFRTDWMPGDLPRYRFPWQLYVAWMYESAANLWVSQQKSLSHKNSYFSDTLNCSLLGAKALNILSTKAPFTGTNYLDDNSPSVDMGGG